MDSKPETGRKTAGHPDIGATCLDKVREILKTRLATNGNGEPKPNQVRSLGEKTDSSAQLLDAFKKETLTPEEATGIIRDFVKRRVIKLGDIFPSLFSAMEKEEISSANFATVATLLLQRGLIQKEDIPPRIGPKKCFAVDENGIVLHGLPAARIVAQLSGRRLVKAAMQNPINSSKRTK